MKFLKPAPTVLAIVAGVCLLINQPIVAAIVGVLFVGALAWEGMKANKQRPEPHPSELSPESRTLLRPLRELRDAIQQVVDQNQDVAQIKVIGGEALIEADTILKHGLKLVQTRETLKKTLKSKSEATLEVAKLEEKAKNAETDQVRDSLNAAIEARNEEISHYAVAETALKNIDSRLQQAEAALAELKGRLATGAAQARTTELDEDDLTGMVDRLRTLSASFTEAESMIENRLS